MRGEGRENDYFNMAKRDYYEVLGLQKGASLDEIKRAYKKMALKWHPDKWSTKSEAERKTAEENFKEVGEAYAVLSDDNKRARYDQFGFNGASGGFGGNGGAGGFGGFGADFDPMSVFASFFGGGFRSQGGANFSSNVNFDDIFGGFGRTRNMKGEDLHVTLRATLEQLAEGINRDITIRRRALKDGRVCEVEETIPVKLPKGVGQGKKYKKSGKGHVPFGGLGEPGDLIINILELEHPTLQRDQDDLVYNLVIPFTTAVLGGPVEIPTLGGNNVRITIPAGTQSGKLFRLKGKGMPIVGSDAFGDLLVHVLVHVPEQLSDSERAMIEKMRDSDNFKINEQKRKSLFDNIRNIFTRRN